MLFTQILWFGSKSWRVKVVQSTESNRQSGLTTHLYPEGLVVAVTLHQIASYCPENQVNLTADCRNFPFDLLGFSMEIDPARKGDSPTESDERSR